MSETNKIKLKLSSILNIPINTYVNDFTFIVNGEKFQTSKFVSDLLSSNICRIHLSDPTFDQITINTKETGNFSKFLDLDKFNEMKIGESEVLFYTEVIEQLGSEHFDIIGPDLNITESENILTRIQKYTKGGIISKENFERDIEKVSTNFYEIIENHQEELISINEEILNKIISNQKLRLKSEDQLLNFINSIFKSDKKFLSLYENVIFKNVSSSSIQEFIDIFDYNDMNGIIWSNLSSRLSMPIENNNDFNANRYSSQKVEKNIKTFLYKKGSEFNGIIKYLTNKTGKNIHENKTIEISSNSISSSHPKNLLNFNQNNEYMTKGAILDAWICFDFKNMKINVSEYSIKSYRSGPGIANIKNWVVEISDDGKNWIEIDKHSNYLELNGSSITKTFKVSKNNFVRYCRIRNNGEYFGYPNYCLALDSIEFYGQLLEQ